MVDYTLTMNAFHLKGIISVATPKPKRVGNSSSEMCFRPRYRIHSVAAVAVDLLSRWIMEIVPFEVQFLLEQPLSSLGDPVLQRAVVDAAVDHIPRESCGPGA